MRKVLWRWGILFLVSICVFGCSKKEAPPSAPVPVTVQVQPAQLPDLEQNKIYLTNRTQPLPPKDTLFKETPDGPSLDGKKKLSTNVPAAFHGD